MNMPLSRQMRSLAVHTWRELKQPTMKFKHMRLLLLQNLKNETVVFIDVGLSNTFFFARAATARVTCLSRDANQPAAVDS